MPVSRLSIKHQLLVIVFIIAFPAVCIIISSGMQERRAAVQNARSETRELAAAIANEQNNIVASTRQLFIALSKLPEVQTRDTLKVQTLLAQIHQLSPQYVIIFVADPSGTIWASSVPSSSSISVADRRYFKNALATGQLSSGEYVVGRTTRKSTFNLGYPIKGGDGKISNVICVGISLDHYRNILDVYNMPKGASFALLDHAGIILTRAIDPIKYVGKPSNQEIFKQMQAGPEQETSIGQSSVSGDYRVQTYRKLRLEGESTPYMYVRVGIPLEAVMSKANGMLVKNMAIYSAFLIIACFVSWMISKRYIIDRVHELKRSSRQLADGDLSTRVSARIKGGELGSLGQSLDDMAQKISDHIRELKLATEEYRTIIQTTSDGFNICDTQGRILDANSAYCTMVGFDREELVKMNISELEALEDPEMLSAHITKIIELGSDSFISKQRRKDGSEIDVEITVTFLNELGGRLYSFVRDVTDRKRLEDELQRAATYDHLTGVFNRQALEERILAELERARRYNNPFSLIMLDIDDFKQINDTLGHLAGDRVISSVAAMLRQNIRAVDSVGRWGGEEFVILLTETREQEAALVAEKLRMALADNVIDGVATVTASFGVSTYQMDDTLDTMINRADDLLYSAKRGGKNQVRT